MTSFTQSELLRLMQAEIDLGFKLLELDGARLGHPSESGRTSQAFLRANQSLQKAAAAWDTAEFLLDDDTIGQAGVFESRLHELESAIESELASS